MFEQDTTIASFEAFATPAALTNDTPTGPVPSGLVDVIIDFDIEVEDETGNIRDYECMVTMKSSERNRWSRGDTITQNDQTFSLQDILSDDGILMEISAENAT